MKNNAYLNISTKNLLFQKKRKICWSFKKKFNHFRIFNFSSNNPNYWLKSIYD